MGAQANPFFRNPGKMSHIYYSSYILISLRSFFCQTGHTSRNYDDPFLFEELFFEFTSLYDSLRLRPAHEPSRSMTCRTKTLAHCLFRPQKNKRISSHVSGDYHRLSNAPVFIGNIFMTGRISPCSTFSMHTHFNWFTIDIMLLDFGYIMRYIKNGTHAQFFRRFSKKLFECVSYPVSQAMSVYHCIINCADHSLIVSFPLWRRQRCTGKLSIR